MILSFTPRLLVTLCLALAACTDPVSGPDTLFAARHAPRSGDARLARAVADRWIAEHPAETLPWTWGAGTLLSGISDLYRLTGDVTYRDYLDRYLDARAARLPVIAKSDDCPPALAAVERFRETGDVRDHALVGHVIGYLDHRAKRTPDGGISHFGTDPHIAPTLWADSLFMFGSVLVRWGELEEDEAALDTYGEQLRVFAAHLQDEGGFFAHAYNYPVHQDEGVYWGRGNGWVLASSGEYLRVRRARGERDAAAEAIFTRLANAVMGAQDRGTGLWWTVVNRPGETYLETSASALFALGLSRGIRAGVLGDSALAAVDLAMEGLRARIDGDVVTGISAPTNAGNFAHYARVPVKDDLDYGVGVALLALVEVARAR